MPFQLSRSTRLTAVIGISTCFFLGEMAVGFYTHSLALIADALHYLNDLVGFAIALIALKVSEKNHERKGLSFGWQRAQLLGAFFNGALLFGIGISVLLQSIERFISLHRVENPKMIFIVGSIGLGLNVICALFLHALEHDQDHHPQELVETGLSHIDEDFQNSITKHHDHRHAHSEKLQLVSGNRHDQSHGHGHEHDLGMMGVLLHVLCDAANNLGVMAAALVIWLANYEGRYYADPGVSMGIGAMIILSSIPLVRKSGMIMLECAPSRLDLNDVQHDLEKVVLKVDGVESIHELHIWQLNQQKTLASVHIVVSDPSMANFMITAKTINECFHAYGIHSATLQPEVVSKTDSVYPTGEKVPCQVLCGTLCEALSCCG
ncbi:cation diffusion facilitator family metal ion transporter [Penicillium taxi]|uniref:cation diffusion facilitator family metal ion transporter n=1 Tax=Penicillium taxi TaxID=168475 RepID=UPI0025456713|nr:cation diffusion facilitator family metal ion transporter [Penicillium taxi]KAJ5895339.1 cation diffusion facilitator family metal ion transporter [Penicillium taxi]